jgi:hypothetical protein
VPSRQGWWAGAAAAVGIAADLALAPPASNVALVVLVRPEVVWAWGLWVHGEVGWHRQAADEPIPVELNMLSLRLGIGGVVPVDDWQMRMAFQAIVEPWRITGGRGGADWRSGAGMLFAVAYRPLPWLSVGADVGFDLLPEALLIRHLDDPIFSAGSWRVRSQVWVAVGGGTWM